jgi:transcriptional regulator with XRE-family HTH domain
MSGVEHFKSALNSGSCWVKPEDTLTIEDVNMSDETLSPIAPRVSEIFADNLKQFMEQNEISTNGVALRSGISQKTLWVTINKKNIPTLDTANRMCEALNVDMRVMMSRLLQPAELNRTKIIGRAIDSLISLPTERVAAVREVMDAFSK